MAGSCGDGLDPAFSVAPGTSPGEIVSPTEGLWLTFNVGDGEAAGDQFRAVTTDGVTIERTLGWSSGNLPTGSVVGKVEAGGEFNPPWSWHLAPDTVEFVNGAEAQSPECGLRPSLFEEEVWRQCTLYAPLGATLTEVKDCRSGVCINLPRGGASPAPGPSPGAPPAYSPCAGKACGDPCTICSPDDPDCIETAVLKSCTSQGACLTGEAACLAFGEG